MATKTPVVQNPTLEDATVEVHNAASVMAQRMASLTSDPTLQNQVTARQSDIEAAVQQRTSQAHAAMQQESAQIAQEQLEIAKNVSPTNPARSLRAPTTNPTHHLVQLGDAGIHPDVTSPTTGPAADLHIPGTGVAALEDLAPGQDLAPSPPTSSSNIVATPNKPGQLFAKL